MSLLAEYQAPKKEEATKPLYLQKILENEPQIIQLLQAPVFGWRDFAIEKNAEGKNIVAVNSYLPYVADKDGQYLRPTITERLDIIDNMSKKDRRYKHIWLTLIYNHTSQSVQFYEFGQGAIIEALLNLDLEYDLIDTPVKISKSGLGVDTKYSVLPLPSKKFPLPIEAISEQIEKLQPDLTAPFTGGKVFAKID